MGLFEKVFGNKTTENGQVKDGDASYQTPDELALAGFVKSRVEEIRGQASRIAHEGVWLTNIAYVLGFNSVFYDTVTRQFKPLNRTNPTFARSRINVNKILPTLQNRQARLCKNPPRYDVVPNSPDSEDKDAARLGQQVLVMLWDKLKLLEKRQDLVMWVQQAGHAYMKVVWDPSGGKPMVDPVTGELGYEGEVRADVVSPLEMFIDPMAKSMDEAQYFIQAKVRHLNYFRQQYPEKGQWVKEEGAWLISAQYDLRINSLNTLGPTQSGSIAAMKNAAIELSYYERASKKHPNGRYVVVANGVVLEDKDLPLDGNIPFVKFDDVKIGGKFFSESLVTHARPIQDQYNRVITQRAAWTNKLLAGKYISPKGAGLAAEALNDQSGEVLEYEPVPNAAEPKAMNIPVMPEYAYKEEQSLEAMLYDIFGINEISRGQLPSAGIPAVGMQFLMEQDDTRIGIVTEQHELAWAEVGKLMLIAVGENYVLPRLLKIAGKNMEYIIREFSGMDLKKNYDVRVVRGSTIPGSKVLRRQEILNVFNEGLLGDPHDPKVREKVLSILEYGDLGEMWQDIAIDMAQIKKQIDQIKQNQVPEYNELDNHALHIQEKNRFRKSDQFTRLSPYAQEILLTDIEKHVQGLVDLTNPQVKTDQMQAMNAQSNPQDAMAQMSGVEPNQLLTPEMTNHPSMHPMPQPVQGGKPQ